MVTSLKLVGLGAFAASAFIGWLQVPVLDAVGSSVWRGIGVVVGILVGAFGAAQTPRAWVAVPVVVTIGLALGATWTEWRMSSGVHLSFLQNLAPAISNYGWRLIGPGALAATVGVLLIRLVRLLLIRWALKRAATPNQPLQPTSGGKIEVE